MTRALAYADAMGAIVQRDWRVFKSYRAQALTRFASLFFSLVLFHFIAQLVRVGQFTTPDDYFAFVVIGLVIMQVFQSSLALPTQLRSELFIGTFERMLVSPLGALGGIVSLMFFPIVLAMLSGVITLVFGVVAFGLPLELDTVALAIPVAALGALSFAPFGVAFACLVIIFKQANLGVGWVISLMTIAAGVYFPIELLPGWLRWVSEVQPLTPAVDLMRNLLVGTPLKGSAGGELLRVTLFTVVLLPGSIIALAAAIRHAQRRGTITEY